MSGSDWGCKPTSCANGAGSAGFIASSFGLPKFGGRKSGCRYGRIGRWSAVYAAEILTGDGVWKPSPDILEKGRFLLSSPAPGDANASLDALLATLSRTSALLVLSLPSIVLMRSASSLIYLPQISLVHVPEQQPAYPLLGPRFWGTRLKRHWVLDRRQFEQGRSVASDWASHLIFLRRHSSQARDTLDRLRGGVASDSWYWAWPGGRWSMGIWGGK
jgi:hypothetical protein